MPTLSASFLRCQTEYAQTGQVGNTCVSHGPLLIASASQHGEIVSSFGYALTLTHAHAIVWPYASTSQSPETFQFTLPSASKPSDPLPVGCLVSPSASSNEPGLVIVMAGSGKVVYWESISSAATFAFIKKDRSGVEYDISGMTVGEKVVDITNAESAGFILSFNTGRLAYLNVRDNHGRPAVSVQYLRSGPSGGSGGFFGSIRNAFSHLSLRGDIAAVRADRSSRVGEKNIVVLTAKGRLQAWRIHRGGHNEPLGDFDGRESILKALYDSDAKSEDFPAESLEVLDFTFAPKGLEQKYHELSALSNAMESEDPELQHLVILVSLTRKGRSRYALVEAMLTPEGCQTGMVRPITSYSTPFTQSEVAHIVRPRVYLPRPALVAYVVFDRAAIIASVAIPPLSPDAQLQSDNHQVPSTFEDVIDFREDKTHEIIGSGFEEPPSATSHEDTRSQRQRTKNPSTVLLVRGAGVIRLVTTDVDQFGSERPPTVTAKSKMEQAVFFGVKQDNPLIFDSRQEVSFSDDEVTEAALELSQEILESKTPFMSTLPAHLEQNLRARSNALQRLNDHIRTTGTQLSRSTKWHLLWSAEKMHVAALLWKRHEDFTAGRLSSTGNDKMSVIAMIVQFIHESQKHNPIVKAGELDAVRHWFQHDVATLDLFVSWAYELIKKMYKEGVMSHERGSMLIYEAMQVFSCALADALEFRRANLSFYGLDNENMEHGILKSGYEGLPIPWTGQGILANNAKRSFELAQRLAGEATQKKPDDKTGPDSQILQKIIRSMPALLDAMLTSVLEHARAARYSADPEVRKHADDFANEYEKSRKEKTLWLAEAGYWEEAAAIARKHGCFSGLAGILLQHIEKLELEVNNQSLTPFEQQRIKTQKEAKKTELQDTMRQSGAAFGFAVYDYLLDTHGVSAFLGFSLDVEGMRTRYLRSKPELAKLSWMNDIDTERDISTAAQTLLAVGKSKEQQAWSKKVELSLGKLALLAEEEEIQSAPQRLTSRADEAAREAAIANVDNEIQTIRIQEELYQQLRPTTAEAVDDATALNFVMEQHCKIPKKAKAARQVYEDGMGRLLNHEALDAMTLIDLLTQSYFAPGFRPANSSDLMWLALQVAETACHHEEAQEAKRLIWRRVFNRDDWKSINDTQMKDDQQVVTNLAKTALCECLYDGVSHRKLTLTLLIYANTHALIEDPREPFQPMSPHEALGVFTEQLDRRFHNFDADFQAKLKTAMKDEDKVLKKNIESYRLAGWVEQTLEVARSEVNGFVDKVTQNLANGPTA